MLSSIPNSIAEREFMISVTFFVKQCYRNMITNSLLHSNAFLLYRIVEQDTHIEVKPDVAVALIP